MEILFITPGTGSFYCGVCMRDNSLAKELLRLGHGVSMLPMYLPMKTDEPLATRAAPIFFGGINVYLQQKFPLFRRTPRWLDRLLDSRGLLRLAARQSGMTEGSDLGALTLSILRGEEGNQAKEIEKLVTWLKEQGAPDVICLSTALQVGLARKLKSELRVPVICFLQGEDSFLDSLGEPHRTEVWKTLGERAREIDLFIAPSRYFAELMQRRLGLPARQVRVVYNGIPVSEFQPSPRPSHPAVIGFLARMCASKGLHTLIDAFILLRQKAGTPACKLRIAGAKTEGDEAFIKAQWQKLENAGLEAEVEFLPNISREEKVKFYAGLSLFSVPATYGEAFGLYVIEALAAEVPVVLPRHGAFPELIEATGGGVLCEPDDAFSLAAACETLLARPEQGEAMGRRGRQVALERFSTEPMARGVVECCREIMDRTTAPA